jgi:competence protein ComEA
MFEDESATSQLKKAILCLWRARQESWLPVLLLLLGIFLLIASLGYLVLPFKDNVPLVKAANLDVDSDLQPDATPTTQANLKFATQGSLYVDVSGAVIQPGLYQLQAGDRVATALARAGGISSQADLVYVSKTLNLAKKLSDSDKIYIPFMTEELTTSDTAQSSGKQISSTLVSINTASIEELDALPGIGSSRAEAIVDNRPYSQLTELVTKKAISQTLFEQIAELITI